MKRIDTSLPGVLLIEPLVHLDNRGFFLETYHAKKFAELGITDQFVQDNQARSTKNSLRGLHYQIKNAQAKLCRVVNGEALDVVVDIRRGSPTFGKWYSTVLSAENQRLLYVPTGFAHGYVVLSDTADFLYKCSDFYNKEFERGLLWNDPELGIEWRVEDPILSEKDQYSPRLRDIPSPELPEYKRVPAKKLLT
jgi:dTDP-4-dehydrorhamnose 3,5-epimerase